MYDLTGFQRDLLYVIVGGQEPHGLAIKEELEDYRRSTTAGCIRISTRWSRRGSSRKESATGGRTFTQ